MFDPCSLAAGVIGGGIAVYALGTTYAMLANAGPAKPKPPKYGFIPLSVTNADKALKCTVIVGFTLDGVLTDEREAYRGGAWRNLRDGTSVSPLSSLWGELRRVKWLAEQNGGSWVNPDYPDALKEVK